MIKPAVERIILLRGVNMRQIIPWSSFSNGDVKEDVTAWQSPITI
jgi:hypothetical protein